MADDWRTPDIEALLNAIDIEEVEAESQATEVMITAKAQAAEAQPTEAKTT